MGINAQACMREEIGRLIRSGSFACMSDLFMLGAMSTLNRPAA
jgi:hypothetical protein